MKFLVLWELNPAAQQPAMVQAVMKMPEYAKNIQADNKLLARYHIVGKHGGAWLYDVASNEELERLLADLVSKVHQHRLGSVREPSHAAVWHCGRENARRF